MAYNPIENYGLVGNMRTVALISNKGSIDWFCYPRFDSPSVFGRILDDEKGGYFAIVPDDAEDAAHKQMYWPDTNVLITRFLSVEGVAEIVDFMPVHGSNQLVRLVRCVGGQVRLKMACHPAFNYARDTHETRISENGVCFFSPDLNIGLSTDVPLTKAADGVEATFALSKGESNVFLLEAIETECQLPLQHDAANQLFEATVDYWHKWLSQCTYEGRWREMVYRSALVLKMLTYEPTGAIVAAPTTSLPESVGGERNWDYRYTWIRDAAFTLYGLMRIGFTQEAEAFIKWLDARTQELNPDDSLQVMYGIGGEHSLTEKTLEHLKGYKDSSPVRVGNLAESQFQLDIYGELMDSIYLYNKYGTPISYELWTQLRKLVNWVCENWQSKDRGIWEIRGEPQHFVYSKLMCWVALDRGLRLANKRSFPADRVRWLKVRDEIYEDIMQKGWNEDVGAFVQYYGCETLDASTLLMPLVFFVSPTDPRMLKTLDAINRSPDEGGLVSDSLAYRYDHQDEFDGVGGEEGTFNMCTFWLVEALTRAGRLDEARIMFEQIIGHANHLGLFSEETGKRGEALGNFPQAFTHLGLISAAFNLDRALS